MVDSLSDRQIEALLSGSAGLDEDLEGIADVLSAVKGFAVPNPEADFSHLFLGAAAESRLTPIELFARERMPRAYDWQTRLPRRVAMAVAALLVLVTMSGGMAYAANGAKPGDLLYGLDRAIEAIGIGDGGADERLAEALALAASDVEPRGLFHAFVVSSSPPTTDPIEGPSTASADHLEDALPAPEPSVEPQVGSPIDYPDEGPGSFDDEQEPAWTGSTGGDGDDKPGPGETDLSTATGDEGSDDDADDTDDQGDETDDDRENRSVGDDADDGDDQGDETDDDQENRSTGDDADDGGDDADDDGDDGDADGDDDGDADGDDDGGDDADTDGDDDGDDDGGDDGGDDADDDDDDADYDDDDYELKTKP